MLIEKKLHMVCCPKPCWTFYRAFHGYPLVSQKKKKELNPNFDTCSRDENYPVYIVYITSVTFSPRVGLARSCSSFLCTELEHFITIHVYVCTQSQS